MKIASFLIAVLALVGIGYASFSSKPAAPSSPVLTSIILQAFDVDRSSLSVTGCQDPFTSVGGSSTHFISQCQPGSAQCEVLWMVNGSSNQYVFGQTCGNGVWAELEFKNSQWILTFYS